MNKQAPQPKEFEVVVEYGKSREVLPIKAPNKKAAEEHAALLLKRRGGQPSRVIGATEKK